MGQIHKKNNKLIYLAIAGVILIISILAYILPSENLRIYQSPIYDLNQNWSIISKEKVASDVDLPIKFDVIPNETYIAERVFEDDFPNYMKLRIRSSMQSLKVLIDGEEIFASKKPSSGILTSPEASVWHFVELPEDVKGKTLTLVMNSPVKAFSGLVNSIFYGRGDSLIYDLLFSQQIGLITWMLIFLLGVVAIIISFFLYNIGDNRLLYLGLFAISISLWMLSEARLLQFFTGNRFILGGISYMLLTIMPILLILYLRDTVLMRYRKLCKILVFIFSLDFIISLFLQLIGVLIFFQTIQVTNSLIFLTALLIIFLLIKEVIHHGNVKAKKFLLYLSVFAVLIIFEIIQFYSQNFVMTSSYIRVGIIVFFGLLAIDSCHYIDELIGKEKETEILRKLAYKDMLTGGLNRRAFERDVDKLINTAKKDFRLVILDINGLKLINDQYGHQEGDKAIIRCYQYIKEAFDIIGECYRLGGDEFVCIIRNIEMEAYEKGITLFRTKLLQSKQELLYKLDVAIGSDVFYLKEDHDVHDLLHDIDLLMYADKKRLKSNYQQE
ncbi:diguanylate cyclase [Alkalibaculum sp. M08DMB]|uniref:Diguanylate cyclase n=1 Tax=Alkalibaculum sporogenes TaxID=2655001 RepID=A0A6A7K8J6_9FIRM|nr:GGDEF domain-containing protein [Alkalibaculum sporogenes]MPW25641.1 diguanylate cyclase [Alkalibaculum sporogenes]